MLGASFAAGAGKWSHGKWGWMRRSMVANWLITGEGRSDVQTLHGKAPFIACRHARAHGVEASLLSGAIDPAALPRLSEHFSGCFSPAPGPITLEVAIRDAATLLANEAETTYAVEVRFEIGSQ